MCSETASLSKASLCWNAVSTQNSIQDSLSFIITYNHLKSPDGKVCKHLILSECDLDGPISGAPTVWPVLLTLLLVALLQVGHHDNGGWLFLPYQSPEVDKHMLFRT